MADVHTGYSEQVAHAPKFSSPRNQKRKDLEDYFSSTSIPPQNCSAAAGRQKGDVQEGNFVRPSSASATSRPGCMQPVDVHVRSTQIVQPRPGSYAGEGDLKPPCSSPRGHRCGHRLEAEGEAGAGHHEARSHLTLLHCNRHGYWELMCSGWPSFGHLCAGMIPEVRGLWQ